MSRLITRIENASARVASRMTNELVNGTAIASAAMAATTTEILIRLVVIARSLPSEQAGRLDREVEARIDAEKCAADHAAQRRQKRAQREDEHGDARRIDADAARHLGVVDG